ncbi:MAG: tetratricopeptide (TPR) repeat protein [Halieaceae bacterium]|jgi:tetratricopeptide (TPR) repeat protein
MKVIRAASRITLAMILLTGAALHAGRNLMIATQRGLRQLAAGLLLVYWLLAPASAISKEAVVAMSEKVYKIMGEVQLLMDAEDYTAAREQLELLRARKLSSYELAHTLNMIGYTWYEQDRIDLALENYAEALPLPDLPNSMLVTLRLTMGQLNLVSENYVAAESHLRALLVLPEQYLAGNQVLLAAALMGQERFSDALLPLQQAIETAAATGNKPRENCLSMLTSVHYELDDYPAMRDVVERLTVLYPRET